MARDLNLFFLELQSKYGGTVDCDETTWFDGDAYFPRYIYTLQFDYLRSSVFIRYDLRTSEYTKPNKIDSAPTQDRHLIWCSLSVENFKFEEFRISCRSRLGRFFLQERFLVKCRDERLKLRLKEFISGTVIDSYVLNSAEFDPEITGEFMNDVFRIKFSFNTMLYGIPEILLVIEIMIKFYNTFVK